MAVRVTQSGAEATLESGGGAARNTQSGVEAAVESSGGSARVTLSGVEVLIPNVSPAPARAWIVG